MTTGSESAVQGPEALWPLEEVPRGEPARERLRRQRAPATLLIALSIGAAVLIPLHGTHAAVAVAVLMAATPGLGVLMALPSPVPNAASFAAIVSASWVTLVSATCAWLTWQSPVGIYALFTAPALIGALIALGRDRPRAAPSVVVLAPAGARLGTLALGGVLASASVLSWAASVARAREQHIGDYGLLPALGPAFGFAVAAAIGLVYVGCTLRSASPWLSRLGLVLVGAIFSVTPALMTSNFLGPFVYKHLGLVDLIASGRPLSDPHDVLQQWPGFYALGAAIQTVSGVPPLHYANGAGALFTALAGIGLYQAVGTWSRSSVVATIATLGFLCTMWVGQIYYGAQALGYALVLLSQAALVPIIQSLPGPTGRLGRLRVVRWLMRGAPDPVPLTPAAARSLGAAVTLAMVAIVVAHPLSPYVLALELTPFILTGWFRRRWRLLMLAVCALPFVWLVAHYRAVGANNVLTGLSLSNVSSQVTWQTSPAQQLAARCSHDIGLVVWGGSLLVLATYARRRLGHVVVGASFAYLPVLLLAAGNYGGEAIYRVWIFTAPWCIALISLRIQELRIGRRVATAAVSLACMVAFLASAQATSYGMFPVDVVSNEEVAASRWLDTATPPGSLVVTALSGFPSRMTKGYAERNPEESVNDPAVTEYPDIAALLRRPDWTGEEFTQLFEHELGDSAFFVISDSMDAQNRYYRIVPADTTRRLRAALRHTAPWVRVYVNPEVTVFRLGTGQRGGGNAQSPQAVPSPVNSTTDSAATPTGTATSSQPAVQAPAASRP